MSEIQFIQRTIAPKGRNKYGNYMSKGNITKSVVTTTYAGNDTTTTIADTGGNKDTGVTDFYCMLAQTNATFNGIDLAQGATATTVVIAYKGYDKGTTYICDFDSVTATTDGDGNIVELVPPENMGIRNLPDGITVTFLNNGTTGTTVIFEASSLLSGSTGSVYIPVNVYKRSDNIPEPDDLYNWYEHKDDCEVVWLEWVWNVNRSATSNYVLDLSNQTAGVNCDTGGTLYPNSIATLQCTATTYFNGAVATGITYSARTQAAYAAFGYSINANTGAMTFNSGGTNQFYWAPAYPALPIDILAIKDGEIIATKTMTISRNYPGTDGTPAHTRYILTDADFIQYDPNTSAFTPTQVTGQVWIQIGNELPTRDNSTTIYQWYDNLEQYKTSAQGSITAQTHDGISSIFFALRNDQNEYYELEEVPVIPKGKDGEPGGPGDPGASGESAWYLTLSNDNASINCDSEGNILPGAIRPTCQAKLYHGNTRYTGAAYVVDYGGASGITSGVTNGILTLTFGSSFDFTGSSVAITINAYDGEVGELKETKIMNITKSYAGENGEPGVTYWIETSFGEVIYNPNTSGVSPSSITATKYKQIGQEAAVPASDATLKYRWQSRSTGTWGSETTYSSAVSVTSGNCVSYSRLRFTLYVGSSQVDQEDVDILVNGLNGEPGEGRPGPAIRGPYDWEEHSGDTRCWCSGSASTTCDECDKWIDVIYKDDTYYYCNTTYYGKLSPWNNVKNYWTSGDTFDFIATNLLLANNAKIKFLTNNALYLMDANGNITGGAKGGTGTTFWAGAENPDDPADPAPFRVDVEGNIYAKKGIFSGYIQYPYTFVSDLMPNLEVSASNVSARYLASTIWKGRLPQAPANPQNGWSYANTVEHQIYYYTTNRWSMVYETGNQDGYLADDNAYLVSDTTNQGSAYTPVKFILPTPTAEWNGFTYEIIVEPVLSRSDGTQQLEMFDYQKNTMYCYAYAELRNGDMFRLTGGKYQVTCMPKHTQGGDTEYRWAVTQATGGIDIVNDYGTAIEKTEFISTLVGISYDTPLLVNKVVTYTGSKPSVPSSTNTMFVKL